MTKFYSRRMKNLNVYMVTLMVTYGYRMATLIMLSKKYHLVKNIFKFISH